MDKINFNELEFNLYEILNLPMNCTTNDIKIKFKQLVKKFHPDKITKLEEKIYYYITLANHILGNPNSRIQYDRWLKGSNIMHNELKNNYKSSEDSVKKYFPKTKEDAQYKFIQQNEELWNRHHNGFMEDSNNFDKRLSNHLVKREDIRHVGREDFRNMDDFNDTFNMRKEGNGKYSGNIIKVDTKASIVPYMGKSGINYVDLKDFNKMYLEDSIITSYYTSLDRAFKLQPNMEDKRTKNNKNRISEYNNMTEELKNIHYGSLSNLDI